MERGVGGEGGGGGAMGVDMNSASFERVIVGGGERQICCEVSSNRDFGLIVVLLSPSRAIPETGDDMYKRDRTY